MNELPQHVVHNWVEQRKAVEKFMYARDTKAPQPAAAVGAGCQLDGHSDFEASATDDEE